VGASTAPAGADSAKLRHPATAARASSTAAAARVRVNVEVFDEAGKKVSDLGLLSISW
jgi:hypothetical protein